MKKEVLQQLIGGSFLNVHQLGCVVVDRETSWKYINATEPSGSLIVS